MNAAAPLALVPTHEIEAAIQRLDAAAFDAEFSAQQLAAFRGLLAGLLRKVDAAIVDRQYAAQRLVAELQRAHRPRALMPGEDGPPARPLRDGPGGARVLPAKGYP